MTENAPLAPGSLSLILAFQSWRRAPCLWSGPGRGAIEHWLLRSSDFVRQSVDSGLNRAAQVREGDDNGERNQPCGDRVLGKFETGFILEEILDGIHGSLLLYSMM
jgi:hypothetical protein